MNSYCKHTVYIVSDIFGYSAQLAHFIQPLQSVERCLKVIDPYDGKRQYFTDESNAYQYFLMHSGHQYFSEKVVEQVSQTSGRVSLIAFSAGASAAWSAIAKLNNIEGMFGFYPSQIRHHLSLMPHCATTLIFPDYEKHFSVEEVRTILASKPQVNCIKSPYLHGFINSLSINFNLQGYYEYLHYLLTWLQAIEKSIMDKN